MCIAVTQKNSTPLHEYASLFYALTKKEKKMYHAMPKKITKSLQNLMVDWESQLVFSIGNCLFNRQHKG